MTCDGSSHTARPRRNTLVQPATRVAGIVAPPQNGDSSIPSYEPCAEIGRHIGATIHVLAVVRREVDIDMPAQHVLGNISTPEAPRLEEAGAARIPADLAIPTHRSHVGFARASRRPGVRGSRTEQHPGERYDAESQEHPSLRCHGLSPPKVWLDCL